MTRACVWCAAPLNGSAVRLRGRVRCGACGAAMTDPWPTADELARAYGDWYRPAGGRRFSAVGDALLRRTRGHLAGRQHRGVVAFLAGQRLAQRERAVEHPAQLGPQQRRVGQAAEARRHRDP